MQEDFGQTLAVWGIENTPYLVLPLIGPSSVRDGIGRGVEFFADPTAIALENSDLEWVTWTLTALDTIERRSRDRRSIVSRAVSVQVTHSKSEFSNAIAVGSAKNSTPLPMPSLTEDGPIRGSTR